MAKMNKHLFMCERSWRTTCQWIPCSDRWLRLRNFRAGALGWSARPDGDGYDGLELDCQKWHVEPLAVEHVESNLFRDTDIFPLGSAIFDNALLMRNIPHQWHARGRLMTSQETII